MNPFPLRVTGPVMKRLPKPTTKPKAVTSDCSLAACTLESLHHSPDPPVNGASVRPMGSLPESHATMDAVESNCDGHCSKMLHDATFLSAVLPFALGQARRHREPLSLLCVAIDRLHGIQELLGRAAANGVIRCVGETVLSLIRSSRLRRATR